MDKSDTTRMVGCSVNSTTTMITHTHILFYINTAIISNNNNWSKIYVYQRIKHRKSVFYCFAREKCRKCRKVIVLRARNVENVEKSSRNVENTRLRLVFCTFPLCSQMPVVFYHRVIHGLGFFIC